MAAQQQIDLLMFVAHALTTRCTCCKVYSRHDQRTANISACYKSSEHSVFTPGSQHVLQAAVQAV